MLQPFYNYIFRQSNLWAVMMKHYWLICTFVLSTFGTGVLQVQGFRCGIKNYTRSLIVKGSITQRGEWPFLTALHEVEREKFSFFCGGSLITEQHVLTGKDESIR